MKSWIIMRKGLRINKLFEDHMILVVGTGLFAGAIFHRHFIYLRPFVPFLFAYITFAMALGCSSQEFKNALKTPGNLIVILTFLHLALPILATSLARLFLPGQSLLQAGIILVTAAPIGVGATIWTGIAGGNVALALTAIVLDTFLSPLITPIIMSLTVGKSIPVDIPQLATGLALMIVLPTILGMLLQYLTKNELGRRYKFITGPTTKIILSLIIAINLAVIWNSLHLLQSSLATVFGLVLTVSCSGFLSGYVWGKLTKSLLSIRNTFIFTIGVRNITAGLVLALNYFPELTAVPVVFSILFQQPLAALSLSFLVRKGR
ncbi:MAG TPA: bile acid:sodium symporter [Bacillota bacterium]